MSAYKPFLLLVLAVRNLRIEIPRDIWKILYKLSIEGLYVEKFPCNATMTEKMNGVFQFTSKKGTLCKYMGSLCHSDAPKQLCVQELFKPAATIVCNFCLMKLGSAWNDKVLVEHYRNFHMIHTHVDYSTGCTFTPAHPDMKDPNANYDGNTTHRSCKMLNGVPETMVLSADDFIN